MCERKYAISPLQAAARAHDIAAKKRAADDQIAKLLKDALAAQKASEDAQAKAEDATSADEAAEAADAAADAGEKAAGAAAEIDAILAAAFGDKAGSAKAPDQILPFYTPVQ